MGVLVLVRQLFLLWFSYRCSSWFFSLLLLVLQLVLLLLQTPHEALYTTSQLK